jgi:hypothetical protein
VTVGAILTLGLGSFSDKNHVVTLGYGTGGTSPSPPPAVVITLVGGRGTDVARRRKYVEIGNKRFRVRDAEEAEALIKQYAQAMQKEVVLPKVIPKAQPTQELDDEEMLLLAMLTNSIH